MGNLQKISTDFSWGEISPQLLARVDLAQYHKSTQTMENAYPLVTGGCTRRPGTTYLAEVYNSNQSVRLIPYIYSTDDSYLLIFNGGKIEFLKNGVFIKSGLSNYQLNHSYAESEISEITYAQAGNSIFLAHPNHPPRQLQRITDSSWNLSDISFTCNATTDYWYENYAVSFKILGGATKFVIGDKFTFSVTSGVTNSLSYTGTGNGTLAQVSATSLAPNETWTVTCIYSDSSKQLWSVVGTLSGTRTSTWRASAYPAAVTFYDQRLWFGGTKDFPQTIWASKIGSYYDFTLGPADSDALLFTIASNNFDQVRHLVAARNLLPLTYTGEFSIAGGVNGTITPSSVKIQPQTFHGSATVKPIRIAQEVVFIQRDGKKARAISYSIQEDANVAPDITLFADHITGSGIRDMCFAQDPHFIAWMTRKDGTLISLTLARDYETIGWARSTTEGEFENVATVPTTGQDDVYLIVKRTIEGQVKRFIERLDYNNVWTDASLSVTLPEGTKATTFTDLNHLEGRTVDVVADGLVHPQVTVTDGQITLHYPANSITVGLHYDTLIELLHPEFSSDPSSTVQGRKISIYESIFRFKDTVNCKVNGYQVPFRKNTDGLDSVIAPFTGDKRVTVVGWRNPKNLKIEQVTPMPFTLLGIIIKAAVNE